MRKLYTSLLSKLEQTSLKDAILNAFWLMADKLFRLGGGLLVGIFVARYLGPNDYGVFNFASSFVWLFSYVATLGIDEILVREILKSPPSQGYTLMGTSFLLKTIGGIFSLVLILILSLTLKGISHSNLAIIMLIGASMLIKTTGNIRYWFDSQVLSKYNVLAENIAFFICCLLKLLFIYYKLSLLSFVWLLIVEYLISSVLFCYYYIKTDQYFLKWKYDFTIAKELLKDSWPLIFSGLAIQVYVKIDQVMLKLLSSEHETGIYAVASRMSEIWYFIPVGIVISVYPNIIKSKLENEAEYLKKIQKLFDYLTIISVSIAIITSFTSSFVIRLLFGQAFDGASPILIIHIWSAVFVFLGVASQKYIITENNQKAQFYRTFIGAVANVILNVVLIPKYGGIGSAIATVISYFLSVFSAYLFKSTRMITIMMFKSFNPLRLIWR